MGVIGTIVGISASATTVEVGQPITFTFKTRNETGNERLFRYLIVESDNTIATGNEFTLPASTTVDHTLIFPGFTTEGSHTLTIKLQAKELTIGSVTLTVSKNSGTTIDQFNFRATVLSEAGAPLRDVYFWLVVDEQQTSGSSLPSPGTDINGIKDFTLQYLSTGTHTVRVVNLNTGVSSNPVTINVSAAVAASVWIRNRGQAPAWLVHQNGSTISIGSNWTPVQLYAGLKYKLKGTFFGANPSSVDFATTETGYGGPFNTHKWELKLNVEDNIYSSITSPFTYGGFEVSSTVSGSFMNNNSIYVGPLLSWSDTTGEGYIGDIEVVDLGAWPQPSITLSAPRTAWIAWIYFDAKDITVVNAKIDCPSPNPVDVEYYLDGGLVAWNKGVRSSILNYDFIFINKTKYPSTQTDGIAQEYDANGYQTGIKYSTSPYKVAQGLHTIKIRVISGGAVLTEKSASVNVI